MTDMKPSAAAQCKESGIDLTVLDLNSRMTLLTLMEDIHAVAFDQGYEKGYVQSSKHREEVIAEIRASRDAKIREAVEREREACAVLAEAHFVPGHAVAGIGFAKALADAIRARGDRP